MRARDERAKNRQKIISEKERLDLIIEHSWLNLGDVSKLNFITVFDNQSQDDIENPHLHLLRIFRNPDYFPFTCRHLFNIELLPLQNVILRELWSKPFPMLIMNRGGGKSFILALYAMLRALLCQGSKIVVVGSAFRQAKFVFEYAEGIWANAPLLRDLVGTDTGRNDRRNGPRRDIDRCEIIIGNSVITFLPLGDGKKIRGQRANVLIADEFGSIQSQIYHTVVEGFAAVSMSPVGNVKHAAKVRKMKELGLWTPDHEQEERKGSFGNQSIIAGTADWAFGHFAREWSNYKKIIESRGEIEKVKEIFDGEIPDKFNWRDYSIIRVPVDMMPDGFMDSKHVARSKATQHTTIFSQEFGSVFVTDSDGFFKRSLIESCVTGNVESPIVFPGNREIKFPVQTTGNKTCKYIYGIDPAAESDNFAVIILECYSDHRRVVMGWSTNKSGHRERIKRGIEKEQNFYAFCARKLRDFMKTFPCERMAIDIEGGGRMIEEAFREESRCQLGEMPIYRVINPQEPSDTDGRPGHHILSMISFARADYVAEANHGLKKDLETKTLLFPFFDTLSLGLAHEQDEMEQRVFDTLEDAVFEIEELKSELTTIVHTKTPNGRDHWDTPQIKTDTGKTGRLHKDRYSALLMANMEARLLSNTPAVTEYRGVGGFAQGKRGKSGNSPMYVDPYGILANAPPAQNYGAIVRRR